MTEAKTTLSPFEIIGGHEGVGRLVETFYRNMDAFDEARTIRAMHAADLTETKRVLKQYFAEWLGGPKDYSTSRGHPRLRMRHMRFSIGPQERDAWMTCMDAALETEVADPNLRAQLRASMAKLADWMRTDPGHAEGVHS
jgi:hemoglobin